jgi:hypothetical protein
MTLAERYGQVRAQATFIESAVVAAHGATAGLGGFRASDVRFFFLLFTNWIEHDVLRPEQDLDLTQVRRVLGRLAEQGWLELAPPKVEAPASSRRSPPSSRSAAPRRAPKSRRRPPGERHALTPSGVVGLVESIIEPRSRRPLEESLFVACFAATYRTPILARIGSDPRSDRAEAERRLSELLDPRRVLSAARRTHQDLFADLQARVSDGKKLAEEAQRAKAAGKTDAEIVARLEKLGSYQLHRVRPLSELMASLPQDLLRLELEHGIAARTQLLFGPMAERARAEGMILDELERALRA